MQGPTQNPTADMRGVIPNSFSHIFECVKASTDVEYLIRCSYLEIYNENIRDLLKDDNKYEKLEVQEDVITGVNVVGLTVLTLANSSEVFKCLV